MMRDYEFYIRTKTPFIVLSKEWDSENMVNWYDIKYWDGTEWIVSTGINDDGAEDLYDIAQNVCVPYIEAVEEKIREVGGELTDPAVDDMADENGEHGVTIFCRIPEDKIDEVEDFIKEQEKKAYDFYERGGEE